MPALGPGAPLRLQLAGIRKSFPGVQALRGVSLDVAAGEVHGLVGENGAGKSTLVGIASGALAADAGTVRIAGVATAGDPQRARELGLAIVHQEPSLMPELSVAENLYLGVVPRCRPPLGRLHAWAAHRLSAWHRGTPLPVRARAGSLSPEQRFELEIVKALAGEARVLVLDEPTEHLDATDTQRLFARLRELAARGTAIVYISHRIRELRQIAQRLTVLRDGRADGPHDARALSERRIVELIVGTSVEREFPPKAPIAGAGAGEAPVLEVRGLSGRGFAGVALALGRGEIVGLGGVQASGQNAFLRALAGLQRAHGTVRLNGRPLPLGNVAGSERSGLRYLAGDRHRDGLFAELSVRENFTLRSLARDAHGGVLSRRSEAARTRAAMARLAVKAPGIEVPIRTLSGGNQQKLLLAAVLDSDPAVLLLEEPTNGVDVGTRAQIYETLRATAARGIGLVVASSDATELAGLCDRVLVFSRGAVVRELAGAALDESRITEAIVTSSGIRQRGAEVHPPQGAVVRARRLAAAAWAAGTTGDVAPLAGVGLAVLMLGACASAVSEFYLSARHLSGMAALLATLALVAFGQQAVMLVGSIDLSVGPLIGLVQVVASFYLLPEAGLATQLLGGALIVATCLGTGLTNWLLTERLQLHPMIATLASYMALQAIALMLRPTPAGSFDTGLTDLLDARLGGVPVTLLAALALALAFEIALYRCALGLAWRGVGSNAEAARLAGVAPAAMRLAAYLACSTLAGLAALTLMSQVGIGDPRAGLGYTLTSLAAVVIGGARLAGGRGSFVGALLGAAFITQVNAAASFLQLDIAWQSFLLGGMILAAVTIYSGGRRAAAAR